MYLGGVLRPQKPTSTCAPPIHVHLQRRGPPSAPPCCFPELRANLRDIPSEGRSLAKIQPERTRMWPCRSRGARFLVCQHRPGLAARLLAKTTSLLLASCQFRASISVN